MNNLLHRFAADETGAAAVEYGLIAALISVATLMGLDTLGQTIAGLFRKVDDALEGVTLRIIP